MRERLRLVGGRFSLMTEVMRGTETLAEVPLSAPANEAQLIAQVARGLES
jgi:signal transduction histidine kinase